MQVPNDRAYAVVMIAMAIWRRLDTPGHDAARVLRVHDGWRLEGTAVFVHESRAARLDYGLALAPSWQTRGGFVRGFLGNAEIDESIVRDENGWFLNGAKVDGLDGVVDLDFGFTPATNFPQLERVQLDRGQATDFTVAWFDAGADTLVALPQHYRREGEREYWYESPTGQYRAMLELGASGFVRTYPDLWVLELDTADAR